MTLRHTLILLLASLPLLAVAQTPPDTTSRHIVTLDDDDQDFPVAYRDADQNRMADGTPSAIVARRRRGDYYLVADSLFYRLNFRKHFAEKRFLDHLMIDAGGSLHVLGARDRNGWRRSSIRPELNLGLADWITPEHGWHIQVQAGVPNLTGYGPGTHYTRLSTGYLGANIDYWANLSALANTTYDRPKTLEFIGVAGLDAGFLRYVHNDLHRGHNLLLGGHLGLRAMVNMRSTNYLYIEPRVTFLRAGTLFDANTGDGYAIQVALNAGVGFRSFPGNVLSQQASLKAFHEVDGHCFFSTTAGGSMAMRGTSRRNLGGTGRISFGRWFTPYLAWRANAQGWAYIHEPRHQHYNAQVAMGPDLMLDAASLLLGYDERRIVNIRPLIGFNLGTYYTAGTTGRLQFVADLHAGAQAAIRLGRGIEIFAEPQAVCLWDGPRRPYHLARLQATMLAGLNYRLHSHSTGRLSKPYEPGTHRQFITGAVGTGCNTTTVVKRGIGLKRRFTMDADVAYGRWFSRCSGWRVGLGNSNFNLTSKDLPRYRRDNFYLHADYLLDLISMSCNRDTRADRMELYAIMGINANMVQTTSQGVRCGLGVQAGIHAGVKITPEVSLYLEPAVHINGPRLYKTGHPIDGAGRVLLGVQYTF